LLGGKIIPLKKSEKLVEESSPLSENPPPAGRAYKAI